ncbi:DUF1810 domain-containing protein [Arthrobacter echini]|uniref:DUF1810 domain-containing protein n=1 Tax=Arthrobacter echini TaxID=1529066 RepID=A0A5D0XTN6_9MICC|nr:DUF1810 domain-containing protein [Arthrobacter echini]TYD00084.1 DUF1810 domain-containing protein [Arthrobacter echini]
MNTDPFDLARFVDAQDAQNTYEQALTELRGGRKTGHWMWFVFPQVQGLGSSPTSARYAIASLDEAQAYLSHPVLGPRLLECVHALLNLEGNDPEEVLGGTDARKLQSSMTLFNLAAPQEPWFKALLGRYYGGVEDQATTSFLAD